MGWVRDQVSMKVLADYRNRGVKWVITGVDDMCEEAGCEEPFEFHVRFEGEENSVDVQLCSEHFHKYWDNV